MSFAALLTPVEGFLSPPHVAAAAATVLCLGVAVHGSYAGADGLLRSRSLVARGRQAAQRAFARLLGYAFNVPQRSTVRVIPTSPFPCECVHRMYRLFRTSPSLSSSPFARYFEWRSWPTAARFVWCERMLPARERRRGTLRRWSDAKGGSNDVDGHWLEVGAEASYASEMAARKAAFASGAGALVNGAPAHREAQQAVLGLVLEFVAARLPHRFYLDERGETVRTLTQGYLHQFEVGRFEAAPLLLAAHLVQEDLFLLHGKGLALAAAAAAASGPLAAGALPAPLGGLLAAVAAWSAKRVSGLRPGGSAAWTSDVAFQADDAVVNAAAPGATLETGDIGALRLRATYATFRRLREAPEYTLVTTRAYVDRLDAVAAHPEAALGLADALRMTTAERGQGMRASDDGLGLTWARRAEVAEWLEERAGGRDRDRDRDESDGAAAAA